MAGAFFGRRKKRVTCSGRSLHTTSTQVPILRCGESGTCVFYEPSESGSSGCESGNNRKAIWEKDALRRNKIAGQGRNSESEDLPVLFPV